MALHPPDHKSERQPPRGARTTSRSSVTATVGLVPVVVLIPRVCTPHTVTSAGTLQCRSPLRCVLRLRGAEGVMHA